MRMQRPFAAPDHVLSRREWRRLGRRARRAHDDEQLARLRELARVAAPVLFVETFDDRAAARLTLPEALVLMVGVSPRGLGILGDVAARGPARFADAGRYLEHWWVEVDAGERQTVLAPRLRLVPTGEDDGEVVPFRGAGLWEDY